MIERAEEKELVERLIRMDEVAWGRFCRLYGQPLLGFVRYALHFDVLQAEEVVQMTLVRCVRSIRSFDPSRGALWVWLKAIARNEAHTLARRNQKVTVEVSQSTFPPEVVEQILQTLDTAFLPDAILARHDIQFLVHDVLLSLPERQGMVLKQKYLEELSVAEIARQMNTSEKAIESLLSRGREAFRAAFTTRLKEDAELSREVGIR